MSWGQYPWPSPEPPKGVKVRCIIWHRPTARLNKYSTPKDGMDYLDFEEWPENQSFPERENAYAYQIAMGTKMLGGKYYDTQTWQFEESDIGPMNYFGMPKTGPNGERMVEDQRGELHELMDGDTIEPVKKGQIVITHYGQQELDGDEDG